MIVAITVPITLAIFTGIIIPIIKYFVKSWFVEINNLKIKCNDVDEDMIEMKTELKHISNKNGRQDIDIKDFSKELKETQEKIINTLHKVKDEIKLEFKNDIQRIESDFVSNQRFEDHINALRG